MRFLMWGLLVILAAGATYFIWRGRQERLAEQARRDELAKRAADGVEDMRKCGQCGAYISTYNAKPCGKAGCPASGAKLPRSE